jgi:hypothetical protein
MRPQGTTTDEHCQQIPCSTFVRSSGREWLLTPVRIHDIRRQTPKQLGISTKDWWIHEEEVEDDLQISGCMAI